MKNVIDNSRYIYDVYEYPMLTAHLGDLEQNESLCMNFIVSNNTSQQESIKVYVKWDGKRSDIGSKTIKASATGSYWFTIPKEIGIHTYTVYASNVQLASGSVEILEGTSDMPETIRSTLTAEQHIAIIKNGSYNQELNATTVFLGELDNDEYFAARLKVHSSKAQGINFAATMDGKIYTWNRIDFTKNSTWNPWINDVPLTEGEHTLQWYANGVSFYDAVITVYSGTREQLEKYTKAHALMESGEISHALMLFT